MSILWFCIISMDFIIVQSITTNWIDPHSVVIQSCNSEKKKNTNISIMNTNSINLGNDNTSTFHPKTNQFVPKPADVCRYCGILANDKLFWKSKNNGCNQHQHHRYLICSDCIQAADWHFQHFSDQGPSKSLVFVNCFFI